MLITLINPYQNNPDFPKASITVNITQLLSITKSSILKNLIQHQHINKTKINSMGIITSNPRNYFIDLLLSKNQQLYYDQEIIQQGDFFKLKRLIKCPLALTLFDYDSQNFIDCQAQSISMKHFEAIKKIGEGTYSQIFLVQRRYDKHLFCMKRINKAQCRQKGQLQMIKNQFQMLEISLKYKIKLYYQFQDPKYVYFIVDYCPFGDLFSLIHNNKKAQESNRLLLFQKYTIWTQVALAIVSLHQRGLIYRDLKPQNVLIDQNQRIKLCDFGFTCKIGPNQKLNSLCGSYEYLAPEMVKKQGYNKSIDLYCLGILLYQLLLGASPFEGITPKNIIQMKSRQIVLDKKNLSVTVKDLIRKLTRQRPQQRLGYQSSLQLFKHQFFKENQDLIHRIISDTALLKNIRFVSPQNLSERDQLDQKQAFIFPKGISYNYMEPFFDVTENVGPKFQSLQ